MTSSDEAIRRYLQENKAEHIDLDDEEQKLSKAVYDKVSSVVEDWLTKKRLNITVGIQLGANKDLTNWYVRLTFPQGFDESLSLECCKVVQDKTHCFCERAYTVPQKKAIVTRYSQQDPVNIRYRRKHGFE